MSPKFSQLRTHGFARLETPLRVVRQGAAILWVIVVWLAISIADSAVAQQVLPTRVIEGRVTNSDGKPIKAAIVEWGHFLAEKEDREIFRTDADGKYRVETTKVGPDFRLGVAAIGFAPAWKDGGIAQLRDSPSPLTVDFKLTAPISLRGKVVDESGKPIEGVRVIAKSPTSGFISSFSMPTPSYPFPGPSREGTTNADGEFLIRYLPPTPSLEADKNNGHPFEVSIKAGEGTISTGKAYSNIDNRIEIDRSYFEDHEKRDGKILGRVLDEATEKPIENCKIVLRHSAGMREFTSENGEFLLDQLGVNRRVQLFVYAKDCAPFVIQPTTSADNGTFIECQLKRKPSLKGIVVDSKGKPIRGAEVVLGFDEQKTQSHRYYWSMFKGLVDGYGGLNFVQRLVTNEDGRFEFGVVDQHATIAIMAPGFARHLRFFDAAEMQTLHQTELKLELEPESSISGIVKLNGVPVRNADLRLADTSNWDPDFGEIKADAEGRFSIQNLSPGTYHLSVYQSSGQVMTSRLTKKIVLQPSESLQNVVLDNPGGNSSLRGKAAPFSIVLLTPTKLEGDIATEYSTIGTVASPEGEFEILALHPGPYTYRVITASTLQGMISRGKSEEVVVSGDTVLDVDENATFPFK